MSNSAHNFASRRVVFCRETVENVGCRTNAPGLGVIKTALDGCVHSDKIDFDKICLTLLDQSNALAKHIVLRSVPDRCDQVV